MISLTQTRFITDGENIFFDILIYIELIRNLYCFFSFSANVPFTIYIYILI